MLLLMKNESTGFTRKKDLVSIDTRRQKQNNSPIALDDFERLLLKAINHYNLYTSKKRLRTSPMRDAGVGITPTAIFKYTQKQRRGDAARVFTSHEIYDKFVPWRRKACCKGLIRFAGPRYWSQELTEFFNDCVKSPGKIPNPFVEVKRLSGAPTNLLWRRPDKTVGMLEMVDEDQRGFSLATWKSIELDRYDDGIQEAQLREKKTRSRGQIRVTQHEKVAAAERGRGDAGAEFHGSTVKLAT